MRCFTKGFIFDLFVFCDDSLMSLETFMCGKQLSVSNHCNSSIKTLFVLADIPNHSLYAVILLSYGIQIYISRFDFWILFVYFSSIHVLS